MTRELKQNIIDVTAATAKSLYFTTGLMATAYNLYAQNFIPFSGYAASGAALGVAFGCARLSMIGNVVGTQMYKTLFIAGLAGAAFGSNVAAVTDVLDKSEPMESIYTMPHAVRASVEPVSKPLKLAL